MRPVKRAGLHVNESWSEETSLRLLELIAAAQSEPAPLSDPALRPDAAPPRAAPAAERPLQVLRSLAVRDNAFRLSLEQWLEMRLRDGGEPPALNLVAADDLVAAGASGEPYAAELCAEALVDNRWLRWLADQPISSPPAVGDLTELDCVSADGNGSAQAAVGLRLANLVAATARAALEHSRVQLATEAQDTEVARRLAYNMAYGLSHELNNPLANIASRARLLAEQETDEGKRLLLSGIVDQAMRGCEMIADLMLVARPPVLHEQTIDLLELIEQLVEQARPWSTSRGLTLRLQLSEATVRIKADPMAAREALWALVRNAIEAARAEISITLALMHKPSEQSGAQGATPSEAKLAEVRIADDGAGLSEHARQHAFDPYFSGREAGRGLGLGLSKADRLARMAGGYVSIENLSEGGCLTRIAWPSV
jgi:signal transduction histidine kinase